jgi:hypothetical protein
MRRFFPISVLACRAKNEVNLPVILRRSTQPNCGEAASPYGPLNRELRVKMPGWNNETALLFRQIP